MTNWDFRHWVAFGLFIQSTGLFIAIMINPELADNQGFMVLSTAVIVTGWVGGAVAFAFAAGIDAARNNSNIKSALELAHKGQDAQPAGPSGAAGDPVHVTEDGKS